MDVAIALPLGAVAGLTIFLGLPIARLRGISAALSAFLAAVATGILVFLLYDVLAKASAPIETDLERLKAHVTPAALDAFVFDVGALAMGLGIGLLSLVYYERYVIRCVGRTAAPHPATTVSMIIALGIGLHNFSEGLAIGESAVRPHLSLFWVLIVGFALHNVTEGFGIAAPLSTTSVSWRFILLLGLIAGGPTVVGTAVGLAFFAQPVFVLFLGLAAGAIFYVIGELLHVGRRMGRQGIAMWGVFIGFLAGYTTDLIVTWGGI